MIRNTFVLSALLLLSLHLAWASDPASPAASPSPQALIETATDLVLVQIGLTRLLFQAADTPESDIAAGLGRLHDAEGVLYSYSAASESSASQKDLPANLERAVAKMSNHERALDAVSSSPRQNQKAVEFELSLTEAQIAEIKRLLL